MAASCLTRTQTGKGCASIVCGRQGVFCCLGYEDEGSEEGDACELFDQDPDW